MAVHSKYSSLAAKVMVAILVLGAHCAFADSSPPAGPISQLATSEPFDMSGSFLRMVGGLLFCLGIFGAGLRVLKRFGAPMSRGSSRRLRIIERLQISQKSSVLLVALDGKEYLLTTGPDRPRMIPVGEEKKPVFASSMDEAYSLGLEDSSCAA